jgi:hypothetical protein
MAVEDDPAFDRFSKALDRLVKARDHFISLPKAHPDKGAAKAAVLISQGELSAAAREIEPKYTGP